MPSDTSRLLSVDIGSKMGWAVWYEGQPVEIGTWDVNKVHKNPDDHARWSHIFDFFDRIIKVHKITALVFEYVHPSVFLSARAAELHLGGRAILQMVAHRHGMNPVGIPVNTIKSCLVKGGANKEQMIDAVSELGYGVEDDNQADAVAVGVTALRIEEGSHDVSHLQPTARRRKKTGGKKAHRDAGAKSKKSRSNDDIPRKKQRNDCRKKSKLLLEK